MRIIPPIKSIIYFEAAARLQSFKLAAIELCVTPGAISHQINTLEQFVGQKLFERKARQTTLTNCGLRYYSRVSVILNDMEQATTDLGVKGNAPTVKIAVPPSLLKNWLLPKLSLNTVTRNNINLEFIDTLDYLDFSKCDLDIAIRYGYDQWQGLYASYMFHEKMIAVCAPSRFQHRDISLKQALAESHPLIYTTNRLVQWDLVLSQLNHISTTHPKLVFQNSIQAIEAAIQNLGIAYVNRILVEKYLETGLLIEAFPLELPSHKSPAYYLVSTHEQLQQPHTAQIYQQIMSLCH